MATADYADVFVALKPVLARYESQLAVKTDTPVEYTLVTKSPSPFPQHKGQPMYFGSVRSGKAYVSLHLMPIYMCPPLMSKITPALKKRMQGKTCFNFKSAPTQEALADLQQLTDAAMAQWGAQKWL